MIEYVEDLLRTMRSAFSRRATFVWFVVAFAGFVTRTDTYGITSIVRALWLAPACYPCLLQFFHSTAWTAEKLLAHWREWLVKEKVAHMVEDRIVLLGDHTKTVKGGTKMPEVSTMHQDSETGSKPSFFRGHHWGCISLLIKAGNKFFGTPLWMEIHKDCMEQSRATHIVKVAGQITQSMGYSAYLVLDAFFAVGPVFQTAAPYEGQLHILTRAKKNIVAYLDPPKPKKKKRGRPRKYGKKLKLISLFDTWSHKFQTVDVMLYRTMETVRYLTLDLLWRPTGSKLRFFLIESSRGRIILMTSDPAMELRVAIKLYCRRVAIETLFDTLKNLLGGMQYHFWSKYLKASSRRPVKKEKQIPFSTRPDRTTNTLEAIEKFVAFQAIVLGTLQLLAYRFGAEIHAKAYCWLRTPCGEIPSEFVTKTALSNIIRANLISFGKDLITQLILEKKKRVDKNGQNCQDSQEIA